MENTPRLDPKISEAILRVMHSAEPLETKEVEDALLELDHDVSRSIVFYRLQDLRAKGLVKGKFVGPGKGVWIWWKNNGK